MSTPDDNKFDFDDEFKLPDDFAGPMELPGDLSDPLLSDDLLSEPLVSQSVPAIEDNVEENALEETPPAEDTKAAKKAAKLAEKERRKNEKAERAAAAGTSKFQNILAQLGQANPFTVLLSLAVAALLIAVIVCVIELGRYHFDIRAKGAKVAATISTTIESAENYFV